MVVQWPAFLGVWAFIAVGLVDSAMSFVVSELMQHEEYEEQAIQAQDAVESVLKPILATFTILAVINMYMLSSLNIVKDKLGNANLKFNGTRLLVLVGNIQESVIAIFTKGSRLYRAALRNRETLDENVFSHLQFRTSDFHFSPEKGYLLHVSLLLLECLLVVCLNILFWRDFDLHNVEEREEVLEGQMLDEASSYFEHSCDIRAEREELRQLEEEGGFYGFNFRRRSSAETYSSTESGQTLQQGSEEQAAAETAPC
jgi:hypothetical protein